MLRPGCALPADPHPRLRTDCSATLLRVIISRFQTVVHHARFVYSPFTSDEMLGFRELLADFIRARIQSGQNIYDQAAAPLKPRLAITSRAAPNTQGRVTAVFGGNWAQGLELVDVA